MARLVSVTSEAFQFYQIGSEQGFLEAPAQINTLILGPGDRADVIVDFSGRTGKELFLRTDAAVFLQIRVSAQKATDNSSLPATLRAIPRIPENTAVTTRELTLADYQNRLGPVERDAARTGICR